MSIIFADYPKVRGFPNDKTTAGVGIPLWNDIVDTIEALPHFLEGVTLFQGPHRAIPLGTKITVIAIETSTIYVAVNPNTRDGGLSSIFHSTGWDITQGSVTFIGIYGPQILEQIWKKIVEIEVPQEVNISFTTNKEQLSHAIFVKYGKHLQFLLLRVTIFYIIVIMFGI